jgi:hypothetical protein
MKSYVPLVDNKSMMKVINVAVTADGCVTDTGTSAKDVWRKTICQLLRDKKANGCPSARIR